MEAGEPSKVVTLRAMPGLSRIARIDLTRNAPLVVGPVPGGDLSAGATPRVEVLLVHRIPHGEAMMQAIRELEVSWRADERWAGTLRPYRAEDVERHRGSVRIQHTLAELGAERLWRLLHSGSHVPALGALTGNQAIQQVRAGLQAIYVSGWQVAADANDVGQMYPDLSLYPSDSVPNVVRRINNALRREDEKQHMAGNHDVDWFVPIVADAEAGFGGPLHAFELMKAMIEAGAAGVHFEDQLAAAKKCGHLGGKVVVPTSEFIQKLVAARLAADVMGVRTLIVARTDANSARLITSDSDPADRPFIGGERTPEGFFQFDGGLRAAIARGLAYAPYADLLWCETSSPDVEEAREFADAIHARHPGKLLAYNCSASFNCRKRLDPAALAEFPQELGPMGYRFQFVTLAGFHTLNLTMFELASRYADHGMTVYAELQDDEFAARERGYRATEHQAFVGTEFFDAVSQVISGGTSSTLAMNGSTEREQIADATARLPVSARS